MTADPRQLDPIEHSLLELRDAQDGRVFKPTRVDASALLHAPRGAGVTRYRRLTLRWMSAAAAVALAFGVWGWIFTGEVAGPRGGTEIAASTNGAAAPSAACFQSFHGCFTGPRQVVATACRAHDYDADGDVDLADFRAYQVASAEPAQIH